MELSELQRLQNMEEYDRAMRLLEIAQEAAEEGYFVEAKEHSREAIENFDTLAEERAMMRD